METVHRIHSGLIECILISWILGCSWVESLEEMMTLLPTGLASLSSMSDSYESVCETLVSWTMESLNEQAAAIQPEVPFKIRHLKTGLRFTSRMFTLSNDLSIRLLVGLSYITTVHIYC